MEKIYTYYAAYNNSQTIDTQYKNTIQNTMDDKSIYYKKVEVDSVKVKEGDDVSHKEFSLHLINNNNEVHCKHQITSTNVLTKETNGGSHKKFSCYF